MNSGASGPTGCVLAVAGRRIDAVDASVARFALAQAERVSIELRQLLASSRAVAVVASAANGADLLALQAAGDLGIHRVVVLPCAAAAFRVGSVADRPGDWGPLFDRIIDEAAYAKVTDALIARTGEMAEGEGLVAAAVAVWDGVARGPGDMTAYFRRLAVDRRFDLHEVRTSP